MGRKEIDMEDLKLRVIKLLEESDHPLSVSKIAEKLKHSYTPVNKAIIYLDATDKIHIQDYGNCKLVTVKERQHEQE